MAERISLISFRDFRPKFLAKSTMARKAADAAIGITKAALSEAGRKHDRLVVLVDPKYTTMDCGHCGFAQMLCVAARL